MISRRNFLKGLAAFSVAGAGFGGYALAEPFRLGVTRYALSPPGWPDGLRLRIAVVADLHVCEPFMGLARVAQIVTRTNALSPDLILLPGDFVPSHRMMKFARFTPGGRVVPHAEWVSVLGRLQAPLGVHAVLGNHDWWEDSAVQFDRSRQPPVLAALRAGGIPVLENDVVRLEKNGAPFWLAGLGSQWAYWPKTEAEMNRVIPYTGVDDLPGTLSKVSDEAPILLMAHEPDIFAHMRRVDERIVVTVSGHTHGGQVSLLGYTPVVPSAYGSRYVYGHIKEGGRDLIVSGGLGCSGLPVRFGVPPEIVMIELGKLA